MDIVTHAKTFREAGKLVVEIPEQRILSAISRLLSDSVRLTNDQRLLDYVANHLASGGRNLRSGRQSPLEQLVAEALAEAAHAGVGLEWTDPVRHTLIHE